MIIFPYFKDFGVKKYHLAWHMRPLTPPPHLPNSDVNTIGLTGSLVARITADKTGKEFMTASIEQLSGISGRLKSQMQKRQEKGRLSRKTTAAGRL